MREGNIYLFGNFNAGTTSTNKKVNFNSIECFISKKVISNIFGVPKLEEIEFHITYDIRDVHYIVHTIYG